MRVRYLTWNHVNQFSRAKKLTLGGSCLNILLNKPQHTNRNIPLLYEYVRKPLGMDFFECWEWTPLFLLMHSEILGPVILGPFVTNNWENLMSFYRYLCISVHIRHTFEIWWTLVFPKSAPHISTEHFPTRILWKKNLKDSLSLSEDWGNMILEQLSFLSHFKIHRL